MVLTCTAANSGAPAHWRARFAKDFTWSLMVSIFLSPWLFCCCVVRACLWPVAKGKCQYRNCNTFINPKQSSTMSIDHFLPKSLFDYGTWDLNNLQLMCMACNAKKKDLVVPITFVHYYM